MGYVPISCGAKSNFHAAERAKSHIPLSSANTRLGLYKRKSGDDAYVTSVSAANPPAVQFLETYKSFPSSVFTSL